MVTISKLGGANGTSPEGYVETPLEQSNIDGIKSLYAYDGYTIINNNENTNMKIMYKTKS